MPFTSLPFERAALAGAVLGQFRVVGRLAWVLWRLRVAHASVYLLSLAAMGSQRLDAGRLRDPVASS